MVKPIRTRRVCFSYFPISQCRNFEKATMPITQPRAKTRSTGMFSSLTAFMMNSYFPSRTRMKLPEIPGRIIVQMAMAPHSAMNQRSDVVSVGERRQMNAPRATPPINQQRSLPFHPLMSESMNMAETIIRPKKNAQVWTG